MLTFIISFLLTSFICLCFFKKNFWENRYLILLINACVALVATLAINFSVRGHLQTKVETTYTKALHVFYLPVDIVAKNLPHLDSLGGPVMFNLPILNDYNWYNKHSAKEFLRDTAKRQVSTTICLYRYDKYDLYVGFFKKADVQDYYNTKEVYFVKSSADSVAYISKKKQYYDTGSNNWVTGFSLPRKATITIMHIPPKDFGMIPDSLIRPIPF